MRVSKYLILLAILSSCAMFEKRDYYDQMNDFNFSDKPMFSANDDFMVVSGDSGRYHRTDKQIWDRTPASGATQYERRYQDSLKRELYHLEARLTDQEFYEFDRHRGDIGSISEQIYFLRLSPKDRKEYLQMRDIEVSRSYPVKRGRTPSNFQRRSLNSPAQVAAKRGYAFESVASDVTMGMPMEKVLENWGTPDRRDVAGDPKYRNERWAFRKNGATKYIYFEQGVVQGWTEE